LDPKGLVALWREALLAQKVLLGQTKGYKNHSQLVRFKESTDPIGEIGIYLYSVYEEACKRGYNFDRSKIIKPKKDLNDKFIMSISEGQILFEWKHLKRKLQERSPDCLGELFPLDYAEVESNPTVAVTASWELESWEKPNYNVSRLQA
jgi:hypothetical protein